MEHNTNEEGPTKKIGKKKTMVTGIYIIGINCFILYYDPIWGSFYDKDSHVYKENQNWSPLTSLIQITYNVFLIGKSRGLAHSC